MLAKRRVVIAVREVWMSGSNRHRGCGGVGVVYAERGRRVAAGDRGRRRSPAHRVGQEPRRGCHQHVGRQAAAAAADLPG